MLKASFFISKENVLILINIIYVLIYKSVSVSLAILRLKTFCHRHTEQTEKMITHASG